MELTNSRNSNGIPWKLLLKKLSSRDGVNEFKFNRLREFKFKFKFKFNFNFKFRELIQIQIDASACCCFPWWSRNGDLYVQQKKLPEDKTDGSKKRKCRGCCRIPNTFRDEAWIRARGYDVVRERVTKLKEAWKKS